jgi:hypothetical protein
MNNLQWKELQSSARCFQLDGEPELIHIVKTGFSDMYMVIHEDAYQLMLGKVEFGTKLQIEEKFKIEL